MYSMVMIDNNTILHVWKLLRVGFKSSYHKKKNSVNCDDGYYLNLLWWPFHNTFKYCIIMLYAWN